jgi:hypothetical protein
MKEHIEMMRALLADATAAIATAYFVLAVADAEGGEPHVHYRERVYAYELYHQLRLRWPGWPYSLGGEVDKTGHPIIRGGFLEAAKPDLLVHVPGNMDGNLAVIEIKAIRVQPGQREPEAMIRDFHKLSAFREIGYSSAFLIAFGDDIERVRAYGRDSRIDLRLVELWHHQRPHRPATMVPW